MKHGSQKRGLLPKENEAAQFQIGYVCRTIVEHLTSIASQEGYPYSVADLAVRVGGFLQDQAQREGMGGFELVPEVPAFGSGAGERSRAKHQQHDRQPKKAIHVRTHGGRTLKMSKSARKKISAAQKLRWKIWHQDRELKAKAA